MLNRSRYLARLSYRWAVAWGGEVVDSIQIIGRTLLVYLIDVYCGVWHHVVWPKMNVVSAEPKFRNGLWFISSSVYIRLDPKGLRTGLANIAITSQPPYKSRFSSLSYVVLANKILIIAHISKKLNFFFGSEVVCAWSFKHANSPSRRICNSNLRI